MLQNQYLAEIDWLNTNPDLNELRTRYPAIWQDTALELFKLREADNVLKQNVKSSSEMFRKITLDAKSNAMIWKARLLKSRNNPSVAVEAVRHIVKSRMLILTLEMGYLASAVGRTTGKVRFNLVSGLIIQKLLFRHDFIRKPVSISWFNFCWRFVSQKRLLMPLLRDKGIYCFYSKELIAELQSLIEGRSCLEIAAGDGTLSRFLREKGVNIKASDDYSWSYAIEYPESVEKLSAKNALNKYQPQVVICSWPPPENNFEKHIFACPSVQLYIAIGSKHQIASGNWKVYSEQKRFDFEKNEKLSSYVIPPEAEPLVLVFRRTSYS